MLRLIAVCFVLIATTLPLRAQDQPDYASAADTYVTDIQARFPEKPDTLEARASRLDGDAAAERGAWSKAVSAYERAIAFGAERLRDLDGTDARAARDGRNEQCHRGGLLRPPGGRPSDRPRQGAVRARRILDGANRAREAVKAYQAGLNLEYDNQIADRVQALSEATEFRLINSRTELSGDRARLCLQFRDNLKPIKDIHYEDYIKIEPAVTPAFTVTDDTLCVDGLDFGAHYTVTALKGLPSVNDDELADTDSVTIEIGDREASLGFPGSAYVLPKVGSSGLPLVSVNVDKAKLQLLRITDRNLVEQIRQGRWLRAIDGYERDQIPEESGDLVWKGEIDIQSERNKRVTTLVPISDVLPATVPGIYVLTAESAGGAVETWNYAGDPMVRH